MQIFEFRKKKLNPLERFCVVKIVHALLVNNKKRALLRTVNDLTDAEINLVPLKKITGLAHIADFIQRSFSFVFHRTFIIGKKFRNLYRGDLT